MVKVRKVCIPVKERISQPIQETSAKYEEAIINHTEEAAIFGIFGQEHTNNSKYIGSDTSDWFIG